MRRKPSDATLILVDLATPMTKAHTKVANTPGRVARRFGDDSAAALGSEDASRGRLPLMLTSFVGREHETSEVEAALAEARLVTLTGPGGSGKTRLALSVATSSGEPANLEDGAWWVGLSSLSDPDLVPGTVASALGVRETPDRTPTEALSDHLRSTRALLILDNCEHLVWACAELVDVLLKGCPGLKILATSREPLGVTGEVSWPVPPLSLPDTEREWDADDLLRFGATRLFVERAQAAAPGFDLTEENMVAVTRLCTGLDGMPLAIELAAARTRTLSPGQILGRLDDRFRILRGGRMIPPRHKTLGTTIDWSHDLLSEEERALFRRLSVFSGGWSLPAAEEICSGDGIERDEVLELLSHLVDKSLVTVSHGTAPDDGARYRMLETVRQYASERLQSSGEARSVGGRHADYFCSLAERAEPAMAGPDQAAWLEVLEVEHDNLRSALGWLEREGEAERGLNLAAALLRFWWFRGHLIEGRAHLERLLESRARVGDAVRAKALYALAVLIYRQADYAEGDWEVARSLLEESLKIFRNLGDERRTVAVLQDLGKVNTESGGWEEARSLLNESLQIGRRSEDEAGVALSRFYLGLLHLVKDDFAPARARFGESLATFRRLDDKFWIDACLVHLGYVECEEGHHEAARSRFSEMDEVLPLLQFPWGATYTLEGFARLAAAEERPDLALRLAGATEALRRTFGVSIGPLRQAGFARALAPARSALGEEAGNKVFMAGAAMTLEEAIALALEKPASRPKLSVGGILTAREAEVISLVAEGLSDAQVAEKLYVSPRTVGGHLRGAYRKLGVKNRTAAIKRAGELDLI